MIANLIGGFVSILVGTSLIGPVSTEVISAAGPCGQTGGGTSNNASIYYGTHSGGVCTNGTAIENQSTTALYTASSWGSTVLNLVPGFFALAILGIGLAVTYSSLRQAGVV